MTQYTKKSLALIHMVGIALRTTNDHNQALQDIPPFWQKFYQQNTLQKIPNKISDDVYAVYT